MLRLMIPGRQARDSAGRTLSVCAEARIDFTRKTDGWGGQGYAAGARKLAATDVTPPLISKESCN